MKLGVPADRARVVGNGVDITRFYVLEKSAQRRALGLPVERAGAGDRGWSGRAQGVPHRVMAELPALRQQFPQLQYLIVGGPSPEGDWTSRLQNLAAELQLQDCVHFTGPDRTRRAALLPVSSRCVCAVYPQRGLGQRPVGSHGLRPARGDDRRGRQCRGGVPPGAGHGGAPSTMPLRCSKHWPWRLQHPWDRAHIRAYAEANIWDRRIDDLEAEFLALGAADAHKRNPETADMAPGR